MEQIIIENQLIAIIIPNSYSEKGIHFFTEPDYSQQLAFMNHPKGKIIEPHLHNPVKRTVEYTQEVLFIKKGKLRVDFFDESKNYHKSLVLNSGDVILLIKGGHGFEVLEEVEMIEVKQGPYAGDMDKTRFQSVINEIKF